MRTGSKTSDRAEILNSPITFGGFGRNLTTGECKALRALGWACSTRYVVVRQVSDYDHLGIVYRPAKGSGYDHAGIYVTLKGKADVTRKAGYYVVKTAFHGGGIVSWHRTEAGAERAAHAGRISSCTCGCAGVVSVKEYDELESQARNQSWTKNPYTLTQR